MSNSASAMAFSNSVDDSHSANVGDTFAAGTHPSAKSVDEIMPLLNQTSITSSTSLDDDAQGGGAADESDNNDGTVTGKGRSHHSGRRSHGHRTASQQSESENERGMMSSFSRKKLKSKYMKSSSKAAKAGIVLDGASGQISSTANAASDSEK